MKKTLSFMLVLTLILSLAGIPAFAADADITMLTLDDSSDFTVVGYGDEPEEMKVVGLTSSYQKVDIENKEGIVWETSDENIVAFVKDGKEVEGKTIAGQDTVNIKLKEAGRATITATLGDKDKITPISSYIVVEEPSDNPTVEKVNVKIIGKTFGPVEVKGLTLTNDSLEEYFDDADVLKENPSALHALMKALEQEKGKEWVKNNIVVKNQGGYVEKIGTDDSSSDWSNGWQYTVNGQKQEKAASIYELHDGDNVVWEFKGWEY
ncbi:DUF4430 domain-containing protein [Inediibacterium massiliense]|uniref:DUF4430 domain-containing protein n=1 Tax=Inediibacterium massiliense TaxID=1658111 RepID=UPI0006B60090|nr:DUF4430 domain-containing protein [Inediibacterium massiliense]